MKKALFYLPSARNRAATKIKRFASMIENDFPRSDNRLLDSVPYQWFDAAEGWFAEGGATGLERQFLATTADALGADGAVIRWRCDKLAASPTPSSDPR